MPTRSSNLADRKTAAAPPERPQKSSARLQQWYVVLAIGFLNAVLLLLLLNGALSLILRLKHPPTPFHEEHFAADKLQAAYPGWSEADVKALIRETPRADREFEYEPLTGFRERAGRGRFVNIDPNGFRYSKNQAPWPPRPGATTVFVFGGSTGFGYYLPDDETIPSYLQECLAKNAPAAVYNFARPAYFSSQELILFQKLLRDGYVPQVAVFIDGLNDFIFADGKPKFTAQLHAFMEGKVENNPLNDIALVRAAHWLSDRWKGPVASPEPAEPANYSDPELLQSAADRWLANKKMIELIAAGYGVKTVFVWQPVPMYKYDLRYHFFLHNDSGFGGYIRAKYGYALMQELKDQGKLGDNVLWLADMQQDKHENLYVDSVHYSAAFSQEIAGRICDYVGKQSGNHR